jgi:membrane protein
MVLRRLPLKRAELPSWTQRSLAALGFVVLAAGAVALGGMPGRPAEEADTPVEIRPRGWKHIVVRAWNEFNADQIPQAAGGVAFFALLAMFPAIAAFVSLYGLYADVGSVQNHLAILAGILPRSALSFVDEEMTRIAGTRHTHLGFAFAISILLSLFSANGAIKALFNGLNTAYEAHERRGVIQLNLVSLAFTIGGLVFVLAALGVVVAAPQVLRALGWNGGIDPLAVEILRWPGLLIASGLGFALLYQFGPCRPKQRWRWITPGSAFAAVAWLAVSMGFSWYVANFGHYERTYGSLGAVVGFMTWLWLSTIVVLAGAELNAETEEEAASKP